LIVFFLWALFFFLFKPLSENGAFHDSDDPARNPAYFYGPLFGLGVVEVTGLVFGVMMKKLFNLPQLLGPLVLGILYNNVSALNVFNLMKGMAYRDCKGVAECEDAAKHTINSWVKPIRY